MIKRTALRTAEDVLNAVAKMSAGMRLTLGLYTKGHEQGYSLTNATLSPSPVVRFAESSNAEIAVYCELTNAKVATPTLFAPENVHRAAKLIIDHLSKKPEPTTAKPKSKSKK